MMDDKRMWANTILADLKERELRAVVEALNALTNKRRANIAAVIVGCTQVLGQIIVQSGPEIAHEVRSAILTLIDDYAMRTVVDNDDAK